jgi:ATP synthase in type III secretion protein N
MTVPRSVEPDRLLTALRNVETIKRVGRVAEARGTLIRATGVNARIGEVCELRDPGNRQVLTAEVVAVERGMTFLIPLGTLEGLSADTEVISKGSQPTVGVGEGLLGRTVDALGNTIDGQPAPTDLQRVPLYRDAPDAMTRAPIRRPFQTGIRALDTVLTVGEGQRLGLFAAASVGKSTLLGMLARSAADINVIVLVGEFGQEVREFIDNNLGAESLRKSVIVVATSDRPAIERRRAAYVGTAIAEYFRDKGKRVLLLLDSVTRFAKALRDVALVGGEPAARGGYPLSVFGALPRLFERAGNSDRGSITAFYTVLVDEEQADPIGEEVRSILDGHLYLSRKLAAANHFPAIDVLASASRIMPRIAQPPHLRSATLLRKYLDKYQDVEPLLQAGEYNRGSDPGADEAIRTMPVIRSLLQQSPDELTAFDESVTALTRILK